MQKYKHEHTEWLWSLLISKTCDKGHDFERQIQSLIDLIISTHQLAILQWLYRLIERDFSSLFHFKRSLWPGYGLRGAENSKLFCKPKSSDILGNKVKNIFNPNIYDYNRIIKKFLTY